MLSQPLGVGLLVAGMHRCGTSALTRILNLLGAALPDQLMPAHPDFNASGFWESLEVVAVNDALLGAANSRWDIVCDRNQVLRDPAQHTAALLSLLKRQFSGTDWFVLKDPRLAHTLPLWIDAIKQFSYEPVVLIALRNPDAVAASLAKRDAIPSARAYYLYLRHQINSWRHAQGQRHALVFYEDLLSDPVDCLTRLGSRLGLDWPQAPASVASQIIEFLKPELNHHQDAPSASGDLAERARQWHATARNTPQALTALADELDAYLLDIETLVLGQASAMPPQAQTQLESRVSLLEGELIAQQSAYEEKVAHVLLTDSTLTKEREIYRMLEIQFDEKCRHIQILLENIEELRARVESLAVQADANGAHPLAAAANAAQAGLTTCQAKLAQRDQMAQQFKREMARSEAQLALLKELFRETPAL